jgi:hypothetical protein
MGWLIGIGLLACGFVFGLIVRRAPYEEELWPTPIDPRSRAITLERLERIRQNELS